MNEQSTPGWDLVIEPGRADKNYWQDLWRYRELLYVLSWRDLRVRYKQTVIGVAWSVLRPLLTMIIFTVVFGHLARFRGASDVPYPILVFAGLIPWYFVSGALSEASSSLIGNASLITKVYFPRIIIPISSIIVTLVDTAIATGLLLLVMVLYRFVPPPQIVLLPAFALLAFALASGVGLFLTALNVRYRDFRHVIPFVIQIGTYVSPVGYSSSIVTAQYSEAARLWFSLNPVVGIIDGFRWCITGEAIYWPGLALSTFVVSFFLFIGVSYFRRMERSFADTV